LRKGKYRHCRNLAVGKKDLNFMAARFMEWGFVILPKTMERDEQTKKNIYKILEQAKVLEELMKAFMEQYRCRYT
jgi:hypothetical protein